MGCRAAEGEEESARKEEISNFFPMPMSNFFPILRSRKDSDSLPRHVPWAFVEPGRERAKQNHDQTLEQLARRGGLCAGELRCALEDRKLFDAPWTEERAQLDATWLIDTLAKWKECRRGKKKS
jgi:hypothetical protein